MNRYRFYEILQAHKKGEDLSAFVPKNAPEAKLIADLQGGAGGSGGVSDFMEYEYNNSNIPNLYYGMPIKKYSKVKINILKAAKFYCEANGYNFEETHSNGIPQGSGSSWHMPDGTGAHMLYLGVLGGFGGQYNANTAFLQINWYQDGLYIYVGTNDNAKETFIPYEDGLTLKGYLEKVGTLEGDLTKEFEYYTTDYPYGVYLCLVNLIEDNNGAYHKCDLNNYTAEDFDWISFE